MITGDVRLLLDVNDFDPNFPGEGLQGDILGFVTGRTREATGDQMAGDLPDIKLFEVSFNTETGVWDEGTVATYYDNDVRDQGTHSGMIAGPNGEEMGGYLVMEGVADIQTVTYQVINWEIIDGAGNITEGQTTGLELADTDLIQEQVNAGNDVDLLTVSPADLPDDAMQVGGTMTDTIDFETEYNARETGVFVTDQL